MADGEKLIHLRYSVGQELYCLPERWTSRPQSTFSLKLAGDKNDKIEAVLLSLKEIVILRKIEGRDQ